MPTKKLSEQGKPLLSPDHKTLYFVNSFDAANTRKVVSQDIWSTAWTGDWENLLPEEVKALSNNQNNAVVGFDPDLNKLYLLGTYIKKEALERGLSSVSMDQMAKPQEEKIKSLYIKWNYYDFYKPTDEKVLFVSIVDLEEHMSLYVSLMEDDGQWGRPQPLLPLNTAFSHEFAPFYDQETKTLYFSSDREGGIGGMDIYSSQRIGDGWTQWSDPVVVPPPISSPFFDAYYSTYGVNGSFFISNRADSLSSIYYLESEQKMQLRTLAAEITINDDRLKGFFDRFKGGDKHPSGGSFTYEGLGKEGVKVFLFNEHGELVSMAVTDSSGYYEFEKLPTDEAYFIKYLVDEGDLNYENFNFIPLEGDEITLMPEPAQDFSNIMAFDPRIGAIEGDSSITSGVFTYKNLTKEGVRMMLYDEEGNVVATALTDANGEYQFESLPTDGNYTLRVFDENLELNMEYASIKPTRLDAIAAKFKAITMEDPRLGVIETGAEMGGKFNYNNLPQEGVTIMLYDEDGNVVATAITDESGEYAFEKLPTDKKYFVRYLVDDSEMNFDLVEVEAKPELAFDVQKDPEGPTVSYGFNEIYPSRKFLSLLDRKVLRLKGKAKILIEGHTDSVGKLETNLFVSMLRAEIVKGYLVRYGFPTEDIEVLGHGPTKPVASNDTPDGRAENRRVKITIEMKDLP